MLIKGIRIIICIVALTCSYFAPQYELWLCLFAYAVVAADVIYYAVKNIFCGKFLCENFLMSIATFAAFYIGQYAEAVAIMLFFQIGEGVLELAVGSSRRSINSLLSLRPDLATVFKDGKTNRVQAKKVPVGELILVAAGETIPLDGEVVDGESNINAAAVTGESTPVAVCKGSTVLSGTVNLNGLLYIKTTKTFEHSTLSTILGLVETAAEKKTSSERFITTFARHYTPWVIGAAVFVALVPPILLAQPFDVWLLRAIIFLVISCPCALVISVPMGYFGGLGCASKMGILIKGSNYMDALLNLKVAVFDKTGTLTTGKFEVTALSAKTVTKKEELLELAAYAEYHSTHPVAKAIVAAYAKPIDAAAITSVNEIAGMGIATVVNGQKVACGNARLMENLSIPYFKHVKGTTIIHVAVDKDYKGFILLSDAPKSDALFTIKQLKANGVEKTVMLTGDSELVSAAVAAELFLDQSYSNLRPADKLKHFQEIKAQTQGAVMFMGDGINDAPVIRGADIGVSMGAMGSDAAIEAADIVIMDDKPSKIIAAILIAKRTKAIVWQNIYFSIGVKALVLILSVFGLANIWFAVFSDVGVSLIAVLNSLRALNTKPIRDRFVDKGTVPLSTNLSL